MDASHGLGLFHASEGVDRYTDFTGYMGAGYAAVRWPEKCFNGQNNWHLGWYSDRATEVDLTAGVQLFKVVSFVQYDRISNDDDYVLLKLNDLYMQFNVDKGFNRDTGEKKNQLTVVQGDMGDTNLIAGLDMSTRSLSWENYQGGASTLTIEICELVADSDSELDYVVVSIGRDGSLCSEVSSVRSEASTYIDTGERCDDSPNGWFFVDATIGNQKISALQQCGWLLENLDLIDLFCVAGQVAYEMCAETCGKCSDECVDSSDAEFSVDGFTVNCAWLSIRPGFWDSACVEGSIAHTECKETCNSCHIVEAIELASTDFACEDTLKSVFWVDEIWGYQSCFWLSAMTDRHEDLCVEGETAYLTCPETCGVCDDSCDDGEGLFEDSNGILRDCNWLSLRPFYWEEYCDEGQIAFDLCMETCGRC
jgi:hypothetical protein